MKKGSLSLILHDIRSSENVGAMFRTADAAGVGKIYLTGYTPTPLDRFGRINKKVAKAALGAERDVLWEKNESISLLLKQLKKNKVTIIALEQDTKAIDYKKVKTTGDTALIVGNEVDGVSKDALKMCDQIVEIPMKGKKESLNVSVALGIALFRILHI